MIDEPLILGIESSCDETACSVVAAGRHVLSSVVASQIELHARYGGVVPELASRAHIEAVNTVIEQALAASGRGPRDFAAVAVTHEPGLIGSLLVGLMAAKTLAWSWNVPLVGVNHVYAHAYAPALNAEPIEYPAVALICSGGHTALYHCSSPTRMELLGSTIDDAAGEAFDKVSSVLRLGYPGGPVIDRAAKKGNPEAMHFPRTLLGGSLDFSFSGLKTAVLYHVNGVPGSRRTSSPSRPGHFSDPGIGDPGIGDPGSANADGRLPGPRRKRSRPAFQRAQAQQHAGMGIENFTEQEINDLAASFQAAVVDVLRIKLRRAAKLVQPRSIILGGGVAANSGLRAAAAELAAKLRCTLRMPELRFCLDNAAMIAGLGCHLLREGAVANLELEAHATVRR